MIRGEMYVHFNLLCDSVRMRDFVNKSITSGNAKVPICSSKE
jgi:hypothetical protein